MFISRDIIWRVSSGISAAIAVGFLLDLVIGVGLEEPLSFQDVIDIVAIVGSSLTGIVAPPALRCNGHGWISVCALRFCRED